MNSGMISTRYARALFEYAHEKHAETTVFDEVLRLESSFKEMQNLRTMLDNPVLLVSDKSKLIKSVVGNKISDVLERFIELVLHQRREKYLQLICKVYIDLYRESKNISVGRLITANLIDNVTENKIKTMVQSKYVGNLEFETQVDPSIGGGFVLYLDTYRLDASVTSQLRNIKEQLLKKNKKIV
ncbi:MAG: F0F1 ATP synthase subunit delta [Dysgonomonas sp.]